MWHGLPVTYGGRIDALIQDALGRVWVFDWKTAAQLTAAGEEDYMLLDDQITSYCWALRLLGIEVAGFIYAEIKKAYPEEPEPMKHARLGRLYSVSKNANYDPNTYIATVSENDPTAYDNGLYDEYIEWMKESGAGRFQQRHQIFRNDDELDSAGENIWAEAADITNPDLRIYPAPGRFGCRFCAFQGPCMSKNRKEDYVYELSTMFDKRRYHYWEDKEPSTEGKGGE
jgi:hypothetical protein